MERFLQPERFDADPDAPDATRQWNHWFCTFSNFLDEIKVFNPHKLKTLYNYISPAVFEIIAECATYEEAIKTLENLYVKPKNEAAARHLLATCKQEVGHTLDHFVQKLKTLARECHFQAVTAEQYRDNALRDAFISGIQSTEIRQRLLEKNISDFQTAYDTAISLTLTHQQSSLYQNCSVPPYNTSTTKLDCTKFFGSSRDPAMTGGYFYHFH
ncbi:hypothetical protein CRM22_005428 [Opisthorchis felineus]|uniref:Retrotransposon gag domain-containing protein n=1 Tax=Opisthorchis felineus TaxID=147828 RepID=A0A4S2LR46_OPIFE|nr:hypothetical protein CRM22_005428 [Opisthorchis felineus]TGZ66244.1 hypothetical protein CRM22_005428 [Opisthorchis felineus]TGZ66245.1 hypothetical protein CRM22_005428 [Opisthorchis felineus]